MRSRYIVHMRAEEYLKKVSVDAQLFLICGTEVYLSEKTKNVIIQKLGLSEINIDVRDYVSSAADVISIAEQMPCFEAYSPDRIHCSTNNQG